jgi:hypothetical protein
LGLVLLGLLGDALGEERAREILKDPAFRAEMQMMIRRHFSNTVATLAKTDRQHFYACSRRRANA